MEVRNIICPNCGNTENLNFKESEQLVFCPFCMGTFTSKLVVEYSKMLSGYSDNTKNLIKKLKMLLADEMFDIAAKVCEKLSGLDFENPELWIVRLLIDARCSSLDALSKMSLNLVGNKYYLRALAFSSGAVKDSYRAAVEKIRAPSSNSEEFISVTSAANHKVAPLVDVGEVFDIAGGILRAYHGKNARVIRIPDTVKEISSYAFFECLGLHEVTISESVKVIGEYAFGQCKNLKKVVFSDGVHTLDKSVFNSCERLEVVIFPNTLRSIPEGLFDGCSALTEIKIPGSVKTVSENAFYNCENLKKVIFCNGVETIGQDCFNQCPALEEVFLPPTVKVIPEKLCYYCTKLLDAAIGTSVREIGDFAFYACEFIDLKIPDNVEYIGNLAFGSCEKLKTIYLNAAKMIRWHKNWLGNKSGFKFVFSDIGEISDKAAEHIIGAIHGDAIAQSNLALCYYNGNGVAQNPLKAKEWWQRAATQGNEIAQRILGELQLRGI